MAYLESLIVRDATTGDEATVTAANALKVDGSAVTQPVSGTVTVVGAGDATAANQTSQITQETAINTVTGLTTDAAVDTDTTGTVSGKLRGLVKLFVNFLSRLPAALGAGGGLKVDGSGTPLPVSGTVTVDTSLLATAAKQDLQTALLTTIDGDTSNLDVALSTRLKAADTLAGVTTVAAVTAITNALPAGTNLLGKTGIDQTTDGTTNKVRATGTMKPSYGATVVLAVTALQSLASSATAGWKSVMVSNIAALANDYEVFVKLTTANTSPANDKAMYVFAIPWYTTDGGSTWFAASGGTATLPTSADATYTIASPHNFRLLGVLNYTTIQMVVQDTFLLSNAFGSRMPDGFSICIINFSGAALSTGCVVDYTPINDILV